jgi:ABC-type amino acid transport substrate-binding protein
VGLASVAQQSGDQAAAERYLKAADDLLPSLRGTKKVAIKLAVFHGQRALLNGKLDDARRFFDSVLDGHRKSPQAIVAALGKAEADLMASDAPAAAADARAALDMARSLQGTLPYSSYTGLSWLMLGRAFEAGGERVQAREAFLAAVSNLSNTVDEDHPELLRARKVLVSSD